MQISTIFVKLFSINSNIESVHHNILTVLFVFFYTTQHLYNIILNHIKVSKLLETKLNCYKKRDHNVSAYVEVQQCLKVIALLLLWLLMKYNTVHL